MANETILLIPKLGKGGGTLREKLLTFGFGRLSSMGSSNLTTGSQSFKKPEEIFVSLPFTESTSMFMTKVVTGAVIPEARVEVNEVTKTTLKNAIVFDFTDLSASLYSITGTRHNPTEEVLTVTLSIASVKYTYNK
jgi:hypothetical protein